MDIDLEIGALVRGHAYATLNIIVLSRLQLTWVGYGRMLMAGEQCAHITCYMSTQDGAPTHFEGFCARA